MRRLRVDLRSDTVSTPSSGMRHAISRAEVGDDVFGEDPSVNTLESMMADMSGFDAAVFMPSGTMSNGVAVQTMTDPGDEVLCGTKSHVYLYEGAQYAMMSGVQMHRLDEDPDGCLPVDEVALALARPEDQHHAPRTLVALENTHNIMGGLVLPERSVDRIVREADAAGASVFLDGARLWHAQVSTGSSMRSLTAGFRMVSLCFSKAMGCPVGSVLLCSSADEKQVRRYRKCHGGGMRQAGILASACIYAIEHNLPVLSKTHDWATKLAGGIGRSPALELPAEPQSNIVFARTSAGMASAAAEALDSLEIGCLPLSESMIRFVTHLSLTEKSVKYATDVLSAFGG